MKDNSDRTLAPSTGTDLARLAIPRPADIDKLLASINFTSIASQAIPRPADIDKIMLSSRLFSQVELMSPKLIEAIEDHQSKMSGLAQQIGKMAKALELQQKSQIDSFQLIAQKLQPLLSQQTKWAKDLSKTAQQANGSLAAIRTMSAFNAFQRYREAFEEFGGGIDPDNVTQEEIERTIEENQELIKEVNEVVLRAESDGVSPGDTPALIYSFLIKRVPGLSKRTYGVIILIFTTAVIAYGLYSNYSTNVTLDEFVVPSLKQQSEALDKQSQDHKQIEGAISDNSQDIKETKKKIGVIIGALDELKEDFDTYQEQTNDKLDLMLEEMRKQEKENKE